MKKVAYIFVSIFICAISCFFFMGCDNTNLFFKFNFSVLTLEVGESVDVLEQDLSTNLTTYAQMHIYSSDESVASVNGHILNAIGEGEATITVGGQFNGKYISASFVVNVTQNVEYETGTFTIENYSKYVLEEKTIIHFSVLLNGEFYAPFTYEVLIGKNNLLENTIKSANELEFVIANNSSITVAIYSEHKSVYKVLNLPLEV